ncbi:hypothetical protein HDU96_001072 [Phlyctochytrium bullatum]|nr:hypothetical protein HDU96_001072 [Phlyctochytrium bullatum]
MSSTTPAAQPPPPSVPTSALAPELVGGLIGGVSLLAGITVGLILCYRRRNPHLFNNTQPKDDDIYRDAGAGAPENSVSGMQFAPASSGPRPDVYDMETVGMSTQHGGNMYPGSVVSGGMGDATSYYRTPTPPASTYATSLAPGQTGSFSYVGKALDPADAALHQQRLNPHLMPLAHVAGGPTVSSTGRNISTETQPSQIVEPVQSFATINERGNHLPTYAASVPGSVVSGGSREAAPLPSKLALPAAAATPPPGAGPLAAPAQQRSASNGTLWNAEALDPGWRGVPPPQSQPQLVNGRPVPPSPNPGLYYPRGNVGPSPSSLTPASPLPSSPSPNTSRRPTPSIILAVPSPAQPVNASAGHSGLRHIPTVTSSVSAASSRRVTGNVIAEFDLTAASARRGPSPSAGSGAHATDAFPKERVGERPMLSLPMPAVAGMTERSGSMGSSVASGTTRAGQREVVEQLFAEGKITADEYMRLTGRN